MQEKSLIKKNILQYIEFKGISKYNFYQVTGITRGILDQNNGMSEENTAKFLAYFADVSPEWLLTGVGPMLRKDMQPVAIPAPGGSGLGIPLIPTHAMAGFMSGDVQVLEFEAERYIIPLFKDAEFLIPVRGSSMQPKFNSGDIVACKRLSLKDIFFQWNKVYVIDTDQGVIVKRIRKGSDPELISIVSDNKDYEPFELHLSQIRSIAVVIGVIRLE